ncbi:MAG: Ribosomal RNA small subunit methyltransferase J [Phycisphaerae bacterium]|nr:Ribosomal RNA small subunit methyltransferase J [Phycisphaerae bacterium]
MMQPVAVIADFASLRQTPDADDQRTRAADLAERLGLPLIGQADAGGFELLLAVTPDRLELREAAGKAAIWVDFASGPMGHRQRSPRFGASMLLRAAGHKAGAELTVCDATAGLGRDAFLLARAGCRVTAVERSGVIAALLADGLARAAADAELAESAGRVTLVVADAREALAGLSADVVCLDPMFPQRGKSAAVKKEMALCRRVAGEDADAAGLLAAALRTARSRVVVKRALRSPPLGEGVAYSYRGTTIRYDVYRSVDSVG